MSGSLRLRLLAGAGFFIALGLVVTWFSLQQIFSGYVAAQYQREMSTAIDTLAAGLEFGGSGPALNGMPADPRYELPAGGRYWAVLPEGGKALRSRSFWDTAIDPQSLTPTRYSGFSMTEGPDGAPILVLARTLAFETGAETRSVDFYAGFVAAEMESALADFRREMAVMLSLTAMMLLLAAVLQVLVGLRPLQLLLSDVARIRSGAASRLRSDVPTEVRPLVTEINDLLDEKSNALERARARAADLAHGLKTPLTAILQVAETLPPEKGEPIIEHVTMIRRRADRQLQRARLGVGQGGGSDLAAIAAKLVHVISAMPADRDIEWGIAIPEGLMTPIDTADLAEALGNILDNARKWAASEVRLTAARRRGRIVLEIADDGPGIAATGRERILERGVHAGDPESETGLGLAIAREIAEAYGGALELAEAPAGGLLVRIDLPGVETEKKKNPA